MGKKQSIDVLVSGGKATAAPPLGPALGPLKVNIGQVVAKINEKTKDFAGMSVPVKVTVDEETKAFEISVGTPPASNLIKKEAGLESGSGNPSRDMVADLKIEQIIKVANMKQDALLGKDNFGRVKEIIGTCQSMGILIEGKPAKDVLKDIKAGAFKDKILSGKTTLTAEELKKLEEERKSLQEKIKKMHDQYVTQAKAIVAANTGKENRAIRKALIDAAIPIEICNEVCPEEKAATADPKKK